MRTISWSVLAAAVLVAAPVWAQPPAAQANPSSQPKWGASLDLEGKLGTGRNLGEGDLFLPLAQDDRNLLFGDVRMRFDDSNSHEGNFGLGVRHMLDSGWNLGGYGYFDRRRTPNDNYFNQLTFGAEALGKDWDFRANSYWPIGTTTKDVNSYNTATLSGASVIFRGGEEKALTGFDAEVGWRVPVFKANGPLDLRLYAGGYTFDASDVPDVTGPRLRAELTGYDLPELGQGTRVTLGTEWQDDDVRGSQAFFSLRLRIPLQSEAQRSRRLTAQERRMTSPIMRDVDIVSEAGAFGRQETATQTASGSAITVISSASTTGANLPTAVANAGANSTVILSGSFDTGTNTTTLQSGQTLMGAGSVTVRAPSGRTAVLSTPSATLTGNVGSTNHTVVMANNSTLTGMTINNTNSGALNNALDVGASGVSGATISNNTLNATVTGATAAQGVQVTGGASNITVSGNTITASGGGNAIAVNVVNSIATVTGNSLSASGATTTNATVDLSTANILSGSSGNTAVAGSCHIAAAGTGSTVTFTNAAACGP